MTGYITRDEFEKEMKNLEKKIGKPVREKRTRPPNEYNIFMKGEVIRLREKDKKLTNQEAFKEAAKNWSLKKKN